MHDFRPTSAQLVYFINEHQRIADSSRLQALHHLSGHGSNICPPVTCMKNQTEIRGFAYLLFTQKSRSPQERPSGKAAEWASVTIRNALHTETEVASSGENKLYMCSAYAKDGNQ